MATITGTDIIGMVRHWLGTPTGSYLGSDYGSDAKSLLQNPQNAGLADRFVAKLKKDIPVLSSMPPGSVSLYAVPSGTDRLDIVIDIAGVSIVIT